MSKSSEMSDVPQIEQHIPVFENSPVPMFISDPESLAILAVNNAAIRRYGYSQHEFQSMTLLDIRPPEEIPKFLEYLSLPNSDPCDATLCRHRLKNGAIIDVAISLGTIDWTGRPARLALACDITSQNRIDDALRKSEERFRTAFAQAAIGFVIVDLDGRFVSVNRAYSNIVGYSQDELRAMTFRQITHPEDHADDAICRQRFLDGEISNFVRLKRYIAKSGKIVWVQNSISAVHNSAGVQVGFVALSEDITSRKRIETVLRESEDRYRDLVEHSTDLICTHDLQGRLLTVNELPARLLGYSSAELIGKPMREFLAAAHRSAFDEYLQTIQRDGFAKGLMSILTKSGEPRIWEYHNTLRTEGVSTPIIRGIAHDITDRKRAEAEHTRLASIVERSSDFMGICGLNLSRPLFVNEAGRRLIGFGHPACFSDTFFSHLFFDEDHSRVVDEIVPAVFDRGSWSGEFRFRHFKSGRPINVLLEVFRIDEPGSKRPMNIAIVARDMTERLRAEETLRQYEKVVEGSQEIIAVLNRDYRYVLANRTFLELRGMTREQVIGRHAREVLDPEAFDKVIKPKLDECLRGNIVKYELKYSYPLIGQRDLDISYFPISGANGVDRVACVLHDLTDRKRAERELRRLSGELLRLQDAERRRIARELHDSTGQNLTALSAMLDQLRSCTPPSKRKSRKLLAECQSLVSGSMSEVRTLSYLLHPPLLDESGIADAIRHYIDGFEKRSGLRVKLEVSPRFGRLSRDVELSLFRVVQESLTNIHRHSGGHNATIHLDRADREVTLSVSDDGHGSSAGRIPCLGSGLFGIETGVGIPSMHERVELIGGHFAILSDDRGTTVRVTLPVCDPLHDEFANPDR